MNFNEINKYYILHIGVWKHNIFFNLTDKKGNTRFVISGGMYGYYGKKIKSRWIFQSLLYRVLKRIKRLKIRTINLQVKNVKTKLKRLVKQLKKQKIRVEYIREVSKIQHGGCKLPRKQR